MGFSREGRAPLYGRGTEAQARMMEVFLNRDRVHRFFEVHPMTVLSFKAERLDERPGAWFWIKDRLS